MGHLGLPDAVFFKMPGAKPELSSSAYNPFLNDILPFWARRNSRFFNWPLGLYIKNKLDEWAVNEQLMRSCMELSEDADLSRVDASTVIMKELWKQLRETHKLRVVK